MSKIYLFNGGMTGCKILLLFLLIFAGSLNAQSDLNFYLESAEKNSPVLKENRNNIYSRGLDRQLNKAQYTLPQVSITANYLFAPYFNSDKLITTEPSADAIGYDASITNGGLYAAQLNLSQNLLYGNQIDVYNKQTEVQIRNYENNIELQRHSLGKDVTELYLNALLAQEAYLLSRALVDTLKFQMSISKNMVTRGLLKQSDYLLLKIETGNQEIASEQNLNSLKNFLYQLKTLCGLTDTSFVRLNGTSLNALPIQTSSRFLNQFTEDSLMVISQQDISEVKYLPQLNVFINAGLNAVELKNMQRKFGMSAGFNFLLPIYDGSQKSITRQQSEIALNTISSNRINQSLLIKNKIRESLSQMEFQKKNITSIRDQLADYQKIISLGRSELMKGQMTMTEYLTIIKNYLDLKKSELAAAINYQQSVNQFNYWNW